MIRARFLLLCTLKLITVHASNNWAILVSTSRFWSNYRDSVNLYYFYNTVKSLGIPDSRILVYLGEDIPCNARNPFPGRIYSAAPSHAAPVYPIDHPRVDVKGNEVNRENFLNMLAGRHHGFQPRSQRLELRDEAARVFVYFSGHSAVGYTKFQDFEDVAAADIADSFETMRLKGMFKELLWLADTCRAASLHNEFYSPGILALGSSGAAEGDKAYSHAVVPEIGQSLVDRFTYMTQNLVRQIDWRYLSMGQYFDAMKPDVLGAVPALKTDLLNRDARDVRMIDFVGSVTGVKSIRWSRNPLVVPASDRHRPHGCLYEELNHASVQDSFSDKVYGTWATWLQIPVVIFFLSVVIRSII